MFDQRAAEAAELGHVELVSGNCPACQAQIERPLCRASLLAALLGLGARQRALVSGGRRPDEQYFCGTGLHDSAQVFGYYWPLSAKRRRTNLTTKITKLTKDAQRLFVRDI